MCVCVLSFQAADLMQANTKDVEGLYNTSVDLDRLNSMQVRFLLQAYRPSFGTAVVNDNLESTNKSEHIPAQWVDFIISGVSQVGV